MLQAGGLAVLDEDVEEELEPRRATKPEKWRHECGTQARD